MTEPDADTVRRLVKSADPAATLIPLRGDQLTRLTEDAMTAIDTQPETPTPRRRRSGLLIGGLAVAAAAVVAAIAIPLAVGQQQPPTVLTLQPTDPMAMCAVVTADAVDEFAEQAFRADVASIADGTVTLTVTERFRGEVSDTVQVVQGTDAALDGGPMIFEDGATYLISAADGEVLTCGLSGAADEGLEPIYDEAFGG